MRWRARYEPERPIEVGDLGPLPDGDTVLPGGQRRRWLDLLDEEPTADADASDLPWDGGRR